MKPRKRCENCQHWERGKHYNLSLPCPVLGKCAKTQDYNSVPNNYECDDTLAYGWDYESYSAGVYAGQNFCCRHWARKEK